MSSLSNTIGLLKAFRSMNKQEQDKIIKGFEMALEEERIAILKEMTK